ncbi:MAG: hypothetical protein MJZ19_01425 [Paludibacteraceae bacterium]|nr:hypothetical protein [Paludibacteraceae bacterium]
MEIYVNIFFSTFSLVVYAIIFLLFFGVREMSNISKMSFRFQARAVSGLFLWVAFMIIGIVAYAYNNIERHLLAGARDFVYILPLTALLSLWGVRRAKNSMKLEEERKLGVITEENKDAVVGFNPGFRLVVFWILFAASVVGTCIAAYYRLFSIPTV